MIVQIPQSTSLRWVQVNSNGSALTGTLNNYTKRLNNHQTAVPNSQVYEYFQKFRTGDFIRLQYTTDADTVTIERYDVTDGSVAEDHSGDETLEYTYTSGTKIYDLDVDTALIGGHFFFRIKFEKAGDPDQYWQSEYFTVDAINEDETVKIEWAGNERLGVYNPGEAKTYYFRLDARFYQPRFGENKATYTDEQEEITVQDGAPIMNMLLELGKDVPFFIGEKVLLALQHSVLKINNLEYQTEESFEPDVISNEAYVTNLFMGSIALRLKTYEVHTTIADDVPPEPDCISTGASGDELSWDGTDCILWK